MNQIGAKFRTSIRVSPKGSQVVIVLLIISFIICLLAGFIFLWYVHPYTWIPFGGAIVLLAIVVKLWLISQKDVDLPSPFPTSIESDDGKQRLTFLTDSKVFSAPQLLQLIEEWFSIVNNRRPLPAPDGLVDREGEPVPGSKDQASEKVEDVNLEAKEISQELYARIQELDKHDKAEHVVQILKKQELAQNGNNIPVRNKC